MSRERLSRIATAAAVLFVLTAYAFFGSGGSFSFRRVQWDHDFTGFTEGYYARLAESFLHGRLDLNFPPDARWQKVVNAYDYGSRHEQGLDMVHWDSSYYRGMFYLYFSAVPVVLFYIPFRLVARGYPPDALAATFFCAWGFLMSVALARRALAGRTTHVPFLLWVLWIGFGNVVPFILADVRTYEVAIATAMAMTATWAYMLLRFLETQSPRAAMWMGLWLALAIATRPNLFVLLVVMAIVLWRRWRAAMAALLPLAIVGALVMLYNAARFGSPFEFGMTYQISYEPIWRHAPCSLCTVPEALRFVNNVVHYLFWPPTFGGDFPFVDLLRNHLDPAVSFVGGPEQIGGVGALSPLTLLGSACALALLALRGPKDPGTRAAIAVAAASWLILAQLSTCRWVTARYALDFMLLLTTASMISIETVLASLANLRVRVLSIAIALVALYAIATGFLLGFRGTDNVFATKHPELIRRIVGRV